MHEVGAEAPVFVCGMGRSGTGWISASLGQSPELTYVQEAWLLAKLEELADWFTLVHDEWTGFTPWQRRGIDRAAFVAGLARWYRELLSLAAGGKRLVEKTPGWNALHLEFLHELFPDAYYVLVYRDGRNCVASLEAKKARRGEPFDFPAECRRWATAMDVFSHAREAGRFDNLAVVRYEDLLDDFDAAFARLCAFAGIEAFRPASRPPNSSFARTGAADFDRRWHSWSTERRRTFKRHAGCQLTAWSYVASNDDW